MEYIMIYITHSNQEEALKLGRTLVEEKLVACANLLPGVTSIYQWEEKIAQESEVVLLAKTRASLFEKVKERVEALHSYQCPCVVALPILQGNEKYLQWVGMMTESLSGRPD